MQMEWAVKSKSKSVDSIVAELTSPFLVTRAVVQSLRYPDTTLTILW
jgi:hypothetical protein